MTRVPPICLGCGLSCGMWVNNFEHVKTVKEPLFLGLIGLVTEGCHSTFDSAKIKRLARGRTLCKSLILMSQWLRAGRIGMFCWMKRAGEQFRNYFFAPIHAHTKTGIGLYDFLLLQSAISQIHPPRCHESISSSTPDKLLTHPPSNDGAICSCSFLNLSRPRNRSAFCLVASCQNHHPHFK